MTPLDREKYFHRYIGTETTDGIPETRLQQQISTK